MPSQYFRLKSISSPSIMHIICISGVYMQGTTEDGLGLMFGVNHLGHFLLTNLLLDRLKECAPSRIITVSSYLHDYGNLNFDTLRTHKEFGVGESVGSVFRIYSHSKLCNVLFTHELAKRLQGTNVTCYSLHPGLSHFNIILVFECHVGTLTVCIFCSG